MSDVETNPGEAPEQSARTPEPRAVRPSMFDDPLVRRMAWAATGLVVFVLLMILGVLVTGVIAPTGPRTLAEREILVGRLAVSKGSTDTAVWGAYLSTLIDAGQYATARRVLADGRASLSESSTAEFTLAEARLTRAQGKQETAIELADTAQDILVAEHKRRLAAGGFIKKTAEVDGYHENYYAAVLLKAYAFRDLKRWGDAIKQFDIYIGRHKGAADILIDRGNAKVEAGDKKGAEADFRQALKFIPDSAEALEGLKRIGAKR